MKRSVVETVVGGVVIAVAILFMSFAYKIAGMKADNSSYMVTAKFGRIDGISQGSDIRIGGIKIGQVKELALDHNSYLAVVKMNINHDIKLPVDSSVQILSDGLLGGKFINIDPGGDEATLSAGGEMKFTQSSVSIENLIGKYIFGNDKKDK